MRRRIFFIQKMNGKKSNDRGLQTPRSTQEMTLSLDEGAGADEGESGDTGANEEEDVEKKKPKL